MVEYNCSNSRKKVKQHILRAKENHNVLGAQMDCDKTMVWQPLKHQSQLQQRTLLYLYFIFIVNKCDISCE